MAFYLHHLPDQSPLPKYCKMSFLIKNWPGVVYLGTTPPQGYTVANIPKDAFISIEPPKDFFQYINPNSKKNELVCIAEDGDHDAACWIDIPRQLEICSMPDDRVRHWLIVPDAYKMIKDEYDE